MGTQIKVFFVYPVCLLDQSGIILSPEVLNNWGNLEQELPLRQAF